MGIEIAGKFASRRVNVTLAFLASEEDPFTTGQTLSVSGGNDVLKSVRSFEFGVKIQEGIGSLGYRIRNGTGLSSELQDSELEQGRRKHIVIQYILGHVVNPVLGVFGNPNEAPFSQLEVPYPIDPHLGSARQDKDNVFLGFMNMLGNLFARRKVYQEDGNVRLVVPFAEEVFDLDGKKGVRAPWNLMFSFHRFHMASFFSK